MMNLKFLDLSIYNFRHDFVCGVLMIEQFYEVMNCTLCKSDTEADELARGYT